MYTLPAINRRQLFLILSFLGLLLVVPLLAYSVIQLEGPRIRSAAMADLNAVGQLKTNQIESWLAERYADANMLAANEAFIDDVELWQVRHDAAAELRISRSKQLLQHDSDYQVELLDAHALVERTRSQSLHPAYRALLAAALVSARPQLSDLYRAGDGKIWLDQVVPLIKRATGKHLGAVILHIPAQAFLFPFLQTWPTPSPSAETLLIRRDGDSVLFLNELRHYKGAALNLRRLLGAPDLPAAVAVRAGVAQTVEGRDYRGVPVLAAVRPVKGTPWFLVAKMDREEIMHPLYHLVTWVAAVALAAVLVAMVILLRFWRRQQRAHMNQTRERDNLLSLFYDLPFMGMAIIDPADNHWLRVNDYLCELLEFSRDELLATTWIQLTHPDDLAADMAEHQRMLSGEIDGYQIEKRLLRKDGTPLDCALAVRCVRRPDGKAEYFVKTVRDISERKRLDQAQVERRRATGLLNAIAAVSTDAIFVKDQAGRYLFFNNEAARALNRHPEEVIGKDDSVLYPPAVAARIMAKDQVIMAGGEADTYEEVLETAAGERTFLTTKGPLKDGDGQTIGLYGIARDISERKLNEERLRRSQEQLLLFIEHAPVSIAMFDREMNYLAYSLRWLQDYGRGYPNLLGRNHYQVNPDIPERWKTILRQGLAGETLSNDSDHWLQADGSQHWLRWAVLPWRDTAGAIGGIIISAEDTTERESVTRALADSRARLAAIIDSAMDAIITLDGEQRISLFNPAAERIFGFKAVELIGEPIDRLIPEQFRQTHRQHMQRFGNATSASKTLLGELRALRSDGSEFPIEASISKVGVAGETIFTVILRDVGERRLADDALRASEERFRSLVEQAADGIFVSDSRGRYLDVNSAGCEMLGYSHDEILELGIPDILDLSEHSRIEAHVAQLSSGEVNVSEWQFRCKNGATFPGEVSARKLGDGRLQAILRDVSERKRAETELRYQLNLIRGITEKSTNAIFITDATGRVTAVNPEAVRLFGYSAEELIGQVTHDLLHHRHPDGRPYPMSECPLCHVYTSGETIRDHEAVFLRKDGSQVIVMGSNSAIEADGKQVGATLVLHDISALKQVERALREREDDLKRAQAVGHIGSWRLDMRRNELTWSEENHRIFEVPEGTQMTYEFFLSCVHPDDRAYVDREWQAGLGGAPYDIEHRLLVDGKVKWVREKAELEFAADGKLLGGFGTTQDISEIKAAELELDMARTAAIEEKTRLETVMQTLPVGVAIVDGQGGNLHCNADYERIWRGPRPAVHSVEDYDAYKAWWMTSGEPVQPHEWASALAIASGELVANQPLRIQRFDGSFASVLNSAAPIRDAHGHIVGSAVVIQDITEIREAEQSLRESEERFQLAAEVGHFGTWDWDVPSGKVFWSRGHYEILGYREGEVTPSYQSWSERVHSEDRARVEAEIRRCMMEKIDYVAEFRVLWPDDSLHWMSARGRSDYDQDGNCTRMLGVMSDITSLKQAELALREADQRKDEFLAMLAHELRNPLAPIRNAAHVLGRLDLDEPRVRWAQDIIERQVSHLTHLVDELLDVSRIARGKVNLKLARIDLVDLVRQACEAVQPLFQAKGHHLDVQLPDMQVILEGDLVRLIQVLQNLLSNAAKYTPDHGRIELAARVCGRELEIRVSDNGMGIPADLLPGVFDLFRQGERTLDRSQGGLGIGLTLVRRLVELHGGRATAASAGAGQGASFSVWLPLPPQAVESVAPSEDPRPADAARLKVLVVDDEPVVAESMVVFLELEGHQVRSAGASEEAFRLLQEFQPRVVLLDIGLPDQDGYTVARKIRQLPGGDAVILVAVSGYGQVDAIERGRQAGFDHYLVKPVDPEKLVALLADLAVSE